MAEAWVLGLMGFACRGSWVCGFCSPLYPSPSSLPLTMRLLSLKFSLVFVVVVVFFFFWLAMGLIFGWTSGLAMGLGLLLNVDGLWWWWLTMASH